MRITGPLYLILIGLLLAAFGGVFCGLMWRSFARASGQRGWKEVPCRILQSEVAERKIGRDVPVEYSFGVLYGYQFGGGQYTSDRFSLRGSLWTKAPDEAAELVERYPLDSGQRCHVDPADPENAVLRLDSKAPGYSLWFPLLLTVGGLGVAAGGLRGLRKAMVGAPRHKPGAGR